jgi:hypothetical protein
MIVFQFGTFTQRELCNLISKPYLEISISLKKEDREWLQTKCESREIIPIIILESNWNRIEHRVCGLIVGIKEHVPVMEIGLEDKTVTMPAEKYCTVTMEIKAGIFMPTE